MNPPSSDPFGTGALRDSVLRAWADSPTRLTEDTNAEADLRVGAYRDRLFVELAQNAADAAHAAGEPGVVRVSVVDGELRFANTGTPLDARGVASLSSLRASAKQGLVGKFGVGFAAVLAVSSEPRVISRTGGVAFSESRTRAAAGAENVPVLRLPWPVDEQAPEGFDTEVRLPLRVDADADLLLERLAGEAEDLLLSLPWLSSIDVDGEVWRRSDVDGFVDIVAPDGALGRWLTQETDGGLWAVPYQDGPRPLGDDVLHAPTPTDERLSLPARLIASVPMEPSRRRVRPGVDLAPFANGYPELVRRLPPEQRLAMVPAAGFPASEVDGQLREAVVRLLARQPWLPTAEEDIPASGARVLNVESPALVELLGDLVPRLTTLCGREAARALATVDAEPLGVAEVVDILTGVDGEPAWWRSVYDALLPVLEAHQISPDDLGALPVPLADGRTMPGPRGALLFGSGELLDLLAEAEVTGLMLVHPEAAHPLLERLGTKTADAVDLLESPALRDAVERSAEDAESGLDTRPLAEAVLRLVTETAAEGLGALALPSEDGWRRADELILPTSPLLEVFDPEAIGEDGALSLLDKEFAEAHSREALSRVGVLDGFVVTEDGIRDLDLVADDAWPAALRLLAGERETWRALSESTWVARNALLAGRPPEQWRLPDADGLAGLFDPVPEVGLSPELLALAGVRTELVVRDLDDAADLLDRLGDAERVLAPGLAARAHTALADAELDWQALDAPARVRAVDGSVVDAELAAVLDQPWLAAVWPVNRLVAAPERAERLAELLDLPVLSELVTAEPEGGEFYPWAELPAVRLAAELLDIPFPDGGVVLHEELTVEFDGVKRAARWWVKSGGFHGEHHAEDSPSGLARAFAWAAGRWADRHLLTALLEEPDPLTPFV